MLLERIDFNVLGSQDRMQLGPFSHRLSGVYHSRDTDNRAILQFVRDVIFAGITGGFDTSTKPLSQSGRIVFANTDGMFHCCRVKDGTPGGRLTVDFEPRSYEISDRRQTHAQLFAPLSSAMVDGVIAPLQTHSVSLAIKAIFERNLLSTRQTETTLNREEIEQVERQIEQLDRRLRDDWGKDSASSLRILLRQLEERLSRWDRDSTQASFHESNQIRLTRLKQRKADLEAETQTLRIQERELRASLSRIADQIVSGKQEPYDFGLRRSIADKYRADLEDLDGQLMRWQETLREVRRLRKSLRPNTVTKNGQENSSASLGAGKDWRKRIESRLDIASRQIDRLSDGYPVEGNGSRSKSFQDPSQSILSMASDYGNQRFVDPLSEIKDELNRTYDRLSDSSDLLPNTATTEIDQLERCEIELLGSIEFLVRRRNERLTQIATEQEISIECLTTAFGDWQQCQDYPHLYDWLYREACPVNSGTHQTHRKKTAQLELDRIRQTDELDRTINRLENGVAELQVVSKQLQEHRIPQIRKTPEERASIVAEIQQIEKRIANVAERSQLESERANCVASLERLRRHTLAAPPILKLANDWLSRLSAGRLRQIELKPSDLWNSNFVRDHSSFTAAQMVHVDGRSEASLTGDDRQLVALALRMATANKLVQEGISIPLLIEATPAFPLDSTGWDTIRHFTDLGQQAIILTSDRMVIDHIQDRNGTLFVPDTSVSYIASTQPNDLKRSALCNRHNSLEQANRTLDLAWREAYGFQEEPGKFSTTRAANLSAPNLGDASSVPASIQPPVETSLSKPVSPSLSIGKKNSPFFLTVDSPVEQAPSVDAVAAARLRSLSVTRVGQLLAADAEHLANSLGLADINRSVVQRWQREADLVCRVRQLRAFDARVLVGCGVSDPTQLAAMHPGSLLEKVEAFLATDRGRQILRSGSSYELSRITSWIAAANRSISRNRQPGQRVESKRARRRRLQKMRNRSEHEESTESIVSMHTAPSAPTKNGTSEETQWRFYLSRQSPVVDAPTIGPRTAAKLEKNGLITVDDLLNGEPEKIARKLENRRIDAFRVRQWQQQATLVCRIPMLRGHDAQLLVAAGISSPEQLIEYKPHQLFNKIKPIALSAEGKRILRGSAYPDLQEVTDWIKYASHSRALTAA